MVLSIVKSGPPNPAILDCRQYYPGSMRTRVSVVHPLAPLAKLPVFSLSLAVRVCPVPPQRTSIDRRRHSFTRKSPYVKGGVMLGHWGGVKLYHPVGSCPPKKSELTGQHKCPRQLLRGMPCLRAGQQTAGRKVLILPILRQARLKVGRQRSLCYA